MATMYQRKSRLTARQQSRLIEHFVAGTTARAAAELVGVQPNTAIRFFMRLRQLIASKQPSYELSREIEADESYFGGKVYTAIIPNMKTEILLPIIQEKVNPDSIVYTDTFRTYNALDVSDFHHMRINHSRSCLPTGKTTSTELKISGTRQSGICANLTASNRRIFTGF